MGRAVHALHAHPKVLDDTWAIHLLAPETQVFVRDREGPEASSMKWGELNVAPLFALNIGSLRYAEDEVARCVREGFDQYLILGAGFDTFALRSGDYASRLRVYEVDHPDVQTLKRERIAQAKATPVAMPIFVPVDFEEMSLADGLRATTFDSNRPCVVSWMNTLQYLSVDAIEATLRELFVLTAPRSRLALNYACDVPLSEDQIAYFESLQGLVGGAGEPMRANIRPQAFEALLDATGFSTIEHVTEQDLHGRYFEGREDGLSPSMPARLVIAERRP
jgi:methyltransferase (TIGR00027 family)